VGRTGRTIAIVVGLTVSGAVALGAVGVYWYLDQWAHTDQSEANRVARNHAHAAVRQTELGVRSSGDPLVTRARVLAHYGRVLSMSGDNARATFVLEVSEKHCFTIEFEGSDGRVHSTSCPENATTVSLPPPPTTLPDLGNYVDEVKYAINALPASSRHDTAKVDAALSAVVRKRGATVDISNADAVVGAAIRRDQDHDCVLVRVGDDVEIWRPESVYRLYGQSGETNCTSAGAIARDQQHPPH
jgi:hypothetical protein